MMRGRRHLVRIGIAGIERPEQPSRIDIEAADHARRDAIGIVVDHRSADDQNLVRDDGRRGALVEAECLDLAALLEVDLSLVAKTLARHTALGIEREHPPVVGWYENASRTIVRGRRAVGSHGAGPGRVIGHAAAGHVLERLVVLDLRIEFPAQLSGRSFEREHDLVRRAGVEEIPHLEWRCLVGDLVGVIRALVVTGAEFPGELEVLDVVLGDLAQRREARTEAAAAVGRPVLPGSGLVRFGRSNGPRYLALRYRAG